MLLHKNQLKVAIAASKDTVRSALYGISVFEEGGETVAVATDSYMLAEMKRTNPKDEEFPSNVPGASDKPTTTAFISPSGIEKLASITKKAHAIESLNCFQVSEKSVIGTDMECTVSVPNRQDIVKFPDYRKIIPTEKPIATVTIDPKRLETLLKLFKGDASVVLEFHSDTQPLIIRGKDHEIKKMGLLMPMRD